MGAREVHITNAWGLLREARRSTGQYVASDQARAQIAAAQVEATLAVVAAVDEVAALLNDLLGAAAPLDGDTE